MVAVEQHDEPFIEKGDQRESSRAPRRGRYSRPPMASTDFRNLRNQESREEQ